MYSESYNAYKNQDISDIEIEESLISSALNNPDDGVLLCDALTHDDFTSRRCKLIFIAIQAMVQEGHYSSDINELRQTLKANGSGDITIAEIMRICVDVPVAINIDARLVDIKAITSRRRMHRALIDASNRIRDHNSPIDDVLNRLNSTLQQQEEAASGVERGFRMVPIGDIQVTKTNWLIQDVIEADTLALIFGDPGTYKSFLAVDFACCVASGKDFNGKPVKRGPVFYIAGEGKNGIARRFKAWSVRHQIPMDKLNLFLSTSPVGIGDEGAPEKVLAEIKRAIGHNSAPTLIVVDTLARNFGAGDENSTQDMTRFIAGCDKIRAQHQSSILLIHHCGIADKTRSRGNQSLKGALDAEYRLEKDEATGHIRFEATKMKDAEIPEPMVFRPAVVEIGELGGELLSSVILDQMDYDPDIDGRNNWHTTALKILEKMLSENREIMESGGFDPDNAKIAVNNWRKAVFESGLKHRSSWKKIIETLTRKNKIKIADGFVSLASI